MLSVYQPVLRVLCFVTSNVDTNTSPLASLVHTPPSH